MIDFTDLPTRRKTYSGANGSKIAVIYNGEQYMLKFPSPPSRNKAMSYTNGCASEYIGCHIFESLGIPVQDTLLGVYRRNGKEKIVVACKDFTSQGVVLQDFASLKNTMIDSEHNGYGTEIQDIRQAMEQQQYVDSHKLQEWFWDMFVVDAFIGNWDRHNGNWGFLYNTETDDMTLAPIYDCGSCLFPQADEQIMQNTLDDPKERELRTYTIPLSGIREDGEKINYFDFLSALKDRDCNRALKRIIPRIDMQRISEIIHATPFITDLQKDFYSTILAERKERILDFSLKKLQKRERSQNMDR